MYADKILPHDLEAEEAVIGSLLIDGEAISQITVFLRADDFYREQNRWCYEASLSLFQRSEPINQVTMAHQLILEDRLEDVGGRVYLSHLVSSVPTSVHIEHYARIVNRTGVMRRLISAGGDISSIGYQGAEDTDEALTRAEDTLFKLRSTQAVRDFMPIRELLDHYLEESDSASSALEKGIAPIATGFPDIDHLLGGFQRTDLVILAARPSLGKSALALNVMGNAAKSGHNVAIFSLEMSRDQIVLRLLSSESRVDNHRLRLGLHSEAERNRIMAAIGELSDLPIYIDDTPQQGVLEMRSKARRLHLDRGVDLIVVDYLQLMQGGAKPENRVQEISAISRSLKGMARDLNVPVLAISQLSRASEQRPSHRPILSDLRDSGSIEQDADVVAFIYRDDVYFTEEEWGRRFPEKSYPKGIAEVIIAKHRHGPIGDVNLFFRETLASFESLSTRASLDFDQSA